MKNHNQRVTDEYMLSKIFSRLVIVGFVQFLILSVTGIVDSCFTGQFIGSDALGGMRLAMPIFSIYLIFTQIMCSSLSVVATKMLGEGKREQAVKCFFAVCSVMFLTAIFFTAGGIFFPDMILKMLVGSAEETAVIIQAKEYLVPILYGALPILFVDVLSAALIIEGSGKWIVAANIALFGTDVITDLFSVSMGGGLYGIAVASDAAYIAAFAVLFAGLLKTGKIFRLKQFSFGFYRMKEMLKNGFAAGMAALCDVIGPVFINRMLMKYGTTAALAAVSVESSVYYVPFALYTGVAGAVLVIAGMLYGEKDRAGIRRIRKDILLWCIGAGCLLAVLTAVFAGPIASLFTAESEIQQLSASALRWAMIGVPFAALNRAAASYLQSSEQERLASVLNVSERLIFPVILTWLLGRSFAVTGIFAALSVPEMILLVLIAFAAAIWSFRKRKTASEDETSNEMRRNISSLEEAMEMSDEVRAFCHVHGIEERTSYLVALCAEELTANIIQHGFKDNRKHHIETRVMIDSDCLILRVRDDGRPFDLTERYKYQNPADPMSMIGLRVIFSSADEVKYSSAFRMNNVLIRINR